MKSFEILYEYISNVGWTLFATEDQRRPLFSDKRMVDISDKEFSCMRKMPDCRKLKLNLSTWEIEEYNE